MINSIASGAQGVAAVVVLLGACILFHEAGHFALAKLAGMFVQEFAIGFGPSLLGFRVGETLYSVRAIPLGGYVKIAGMDLENREVERGFYTFPRWQGFGVLLAGSVMNVVLAALVFTVIATVSGLPVFPDYTVRISKVLPGTAAESAGLEGGDVVVAIDGISHGLFIEEVRPKGPAAQAGMRPTDLIYQVGSKDVSVPPQALAALRERAGGTAKVKVARYDAEGNITDLPELDIRVPGEVAEAATEVQAARVLEEVLGVKLAPLDRVATVGYMSDRPGKQVALTVNREGQELAVNVTPRAEWARVAAQDAQGRLSSTHKKVGRIGVVLTGTREKVGAIRGILHGVQRSYEALTMVTYGLHEMIRGRVAPEASGPVGIAAMTAERAKMGWTAVAELLGIISANLAIINLFPIPPFDGFKIVALGIEAIMRRRIKPKQELAVTVAGIALILGLFLVITFKDILNLIVYNTP